MYHAGMKENGERRRKRTVASELASWIVARDASLSEVCRRTGIRHLVLSDLLSGRQRLNRRLAHQLSALGHLSAAEWLALDAAHD